MANRAGNDRGQSWQEMGDSTRSIAKATSDEGNATAEVVHARLYTWDAGGGTWVRGTGAGGGGGGGDGAILDGVSAAIKATVKDYVNSNPLSVVLTDTSGDAYTAGAAPGGLTDAQLRATPVPVSGSGVFHVDDNASTLSVDDGGGSLTVDGSVSVSNFPAVQPVSDNGGVLSVDDAGGSLTVDGTVSVSGSVDTELPAAAAISADNQAAPTAPSVYNFPLIWDAGGGNWDRAAQGLTDAQLRASAVPVSGPLTDAQLRAATVPISGTVTANAGTGPFPVSDNAGSLTVDAPVGTPVFVRLSDGTAAQIGQKSMLNSLPVVLASDQSAIPASQSGVWLVNGDVDHDAVNTLKQIQVAGHASPVDLPPTAVSANGDRARIWVDKFGAQIVRRRKIRESYTAVFRLAEAAARLDQTFTLTANTNKQYATLHHTAAATKELQLNKVVVWMTGATAVAPQGIIELRELSVTTPPATGNPAITGRPHRIGTGAHEAVALYLPTTQGSEAAVNSPLAHFVTDEAVSVATAAFAHPQGYATGGLVLFDASQLDDQVMAPTAPVGVYGGWAVVARMTGATALRLTVLMVFTEEIP